MGISMSLSVESPFVFGVKVSGETFTDRVVETERLKANFEHGINTILISPRRMGKTSLVEKVRTVVESDTLKIARFDAFGCRSDADFVNALATAVINATSTRLEEWLENAKQFLSHFVPKIQLGTDPSTDFSIVFDLDQAPSSIEEILELPEEIAKKKGIRIVVCIDEFQQVGEFDNSLTFQKKIRGVWQMHKHVSYCLYGSKKSMMEKMFHDQSNPFYRFGDLFYLKKIARTDWVQFIIERFQTTGKLISEELAGAIADATQCYSAYVQQLAWFLWLRTKEEATPEDLSASIDQLLDSCEPLFIVQTEKLTRLQMNFLKALCDGVTSGFSEQKILKHYGLLNSANVARVKGSLIEKDLVVVESRGMVEMADPILALWLKRRVWKA